MLSYQENINYNKLACQAMREGAFWLGKILVIEVLGVTIVSQSAWNA